MCAVARLWRFVLLVLDVLRFVEMMHSRHAQVRAFVGKLASSVLFQRRLNVQSDRKTTERADVGRHSLAVSFRRRLLCGP